MATTTNYGWTTPDNTALVKDGASAIRTLGSSIDTTLKAQIDAQIPKSTITTKGDLIVGTGSGTFVRQGIGANGTVLVADSAEADGLKWAVPSSGSRTLLSTTTLSGASTTISSISGSYNSLYVVVYGVTNATNTNSFYCYPNGSTTICYTGGVVAGSIISQNDTVIQLSGDQGQNPLRTDSNNQFVC